MKLTRQSLLIFVLLLSVSSVCAQQAMLKGKVAFENPRERGTEINITVRDRDSGQIVKGEQLKTRVEDWFHVAHLNTLVDVEFDGGTCYLGDGHPAIRVKQANEVLQKLVLQQTRECKQKELIEQKKSVSRARGQVRARRAGGAAAVDDAVEVLAKGIGTDESALTALIPSPQELKQELEAEAAHARNGEFFDTFQYKFALKSELYSSRPDLMEVLTDFRAKTENSVFFKAIGQVKPEMFTDIVRRELQASGNVNLDNIIAVVKEDSASQNIRGNATVALLNDSLPDDKLRQLREYYRQQSPSSPIFETSLIALGSIGEAEDRARHIAHVTDGSVETRIIAMEALSLATLIAGLEAYPDASKTLANVAATSEDPMIRAVAFRSLRSFVGKGDETAFRALLGGVKDQNTGVRVQVALALGAGKTEEDPKVRTLLHNLSVSDKSLQVREAARVSLSGASTTDWFASILPNNSPK